MCLKCEKRQFFENVYCFRFELFLTYSIILVKRIRNYYPFDKMPGRVFTHFPKYQAVVFNSVSQDNNFNVNSTNQYDECDQQGNDSSSTIEIR